MAEVRDEVRMNVSGLANGSGFVFAAVHNIQAGAPSANIVALFEEAIALRENVR